MTKGRAAKVVLEETPPHLIQGTLGVLNFPVTSCFTEACSDPQPRDCHRTRVAFRFHRALYAGGFTIVNIDGQRTG